MGRGGKFTYLWKFKALALKKQVKAKSQKSTFAWKGLIRLWMGLIASPLSAIASPLLSRWSPQCSMQCTLAWRQVFFIANQSVVTECLGLFPVFFWLQLHPQSVPDWPTGPSDPLKCSEEYDLSTHFLAIVMWPCTQIQSLGFQGYFWRAVCIAADRISKQPPAFFRKGKWLGFSSGGRKKKPWQDSNTLHIKVAEVTVSRHANILKQAPWYSSFPDTETASRCTGYTISCSTHAKNRGGLGSVLFMEGFEDRHKVCEGWAEGGFWFPTVFH